MIRLAVLDFSGLKSDFNPASLGEKERFRIETTKNEKKRLERLASRLLLQRIYQESFSADMPEIEYESFGRPHFSEIDGERRVSFSISHSEKLCALFISDEKNVGADMELICEDTARIERAQARFLKNLDEESRKKLFGNGLFDFDLSFYGFSHGKIEKLEDYLGISLLCEGGDRDETFTLKWERFSEKEEKHLAWTGLESVVKLHGKGLSDSKNVNNYLQKSTVLPFVLQHGGLSWAVSLAIE